MIDFINKLQVEFNIRIIESKRPIRGKNTFNLDEKGNITNLFFYEVKLNTLDVLLPIATNLIELTIRDGNIQSLDKLKYFSKIEKLNLSFNPLLEKTISNIEYLENLKILDLSAIDLQHTYLLKNLINIEELYIGLNCDIEEVKGLEKLKKIKIIDLQSNAISSIHKINLHDTISSINLKSTEIEKIIGLDKFPNLASLNLSSNRISKIEGLSFLKKLKKLNISSSWIKKIEGLEKLTDLEVLDMSNQSIRKIEGLEKLTKLRKLNLAENKLTTVENLDKLVNLEYLLLDCNPIKMFDHKFLHFLQSSCLVSLCYTGLKTIESVIPKNVNIKFEDLKYMPRTLF